MKFHLLPIGEAFSYQGVTYTKSGPLTGSSDEDGSNKMIPRSANILVSKNMELKDAADKQEVSLLSTDVTKAINQYHDLINECLMDIKNEIDGERYKIVQLKLSTGYRALLDKLALS